MYDMHILAGQTSQQLVGHVTTRNCHKMATHTLVPSGHLTFDSVAPRIRINHSGFPACQNTRRIQDCLGICMGVEIHHQLWPLRMQSTRGTTQLGQGAKQLQANCLVRNGWASMNRLPENYDVAI